MWISGFGPCSSPFFPWDHFGDNRGKTGEKNLNSPPFAFPFPFPPMIRADRVFCRKTGTGYIVSYFQKKIKRPAACSGAGKPGIRPFCQPEELSTSFTIARFTSCEKENPGPARILCAWKESYAGVIHKKREFIHLQNWRLYSTMGHAGVSARTLRQGDDPLGPCSRRKDRPRYHSAISLPHKGGRWGLRGPSSATSKVATPLYGEIAPCSVDLTADEIPATGGHRRFVPVPGE